jgi:uncharacterized membrane protein YjfL (UPF0719 family)
MVVIDAILATLVYLVVAFLLFYIGKRAYQLIHRKVDVQYELVENDNLAFAVAHTGYFIGLLAALGGALMGESHGFLLDMLDMCIYGVLAIVLMNLSIIVNDKIVLRKFSVYKEILEDKNVGTGVVEGAMAVATGLVILGSISGEGGGILTALAYWVIGQAILIITAFVYNWITPYDIHEHIEKDNVAVGIGFAGALIAVGNLVRFALMHDFEGWIITVETVAIDAGIGLVFLPIARWIADKILLPGQKLTDELINQEHPNIGAGVIEAFAYIGGSVLITWCL